MQTSRRHQRQPARRVLCVLIAGLAACQAPDEPATDPLEAAIDVRTDELLADMTLDEKVAQKSGSGLVAGSWRTPANERLGLHGLAMVDGPRGVSKFTGKNTAFPVAMARGATWDPELERRVAAAIGREVHARGASVLLGPCINMLRHPRWGRAQETYGEDVHHLSVMGTAFVRGAQEDAGVMASAKHFVANSIEDTRFDVNVSVEPRAMREVYLPAFRAVVEDADVASIMTAYNSVDGAIMSQQADLLAIPRDEWGFAGFYESDWLWGTETTVEAAEAGLDIEMPSGAHFGDDLLAAVEAGEVSMATLDASVRRIVRAQVAWGLVDEGPVPTWEMGDPGVIEQPEHLALAREVATRSMVLLRNEQGALPLDVDALETIAVVGELADTPNIGDEGSSDVAPSEVVTPLQGLQAAAPELLIEHVAAEDVLDASAAADVAAADVAIVVVGLTTEDESEFIPQISPAGDREDLELSPAHRQLIADTVAANPNTIVVLEGGSAIVVDPWHEQVPAIVMAWYPGGQGGHALADLLLGKANFSGHLPLTIPVAEADLVPFDNESLQVDYGYFHGYRALDRAGVQARYSFGHGLSYTEFDYADLRETDDGDPDTLSFAVDVTNVGERAGVDVVQLYVGYPDSEVERNVRELRAFATVDLAPGETATVPLVVEAEDLAYWDPTTKAWRFEPGPMRVEVGRSAGDLPLTLMTP